MQFISFRVIWKRIKAIRFFMKDKTVPIRKKLLIVLGIAYLLMPIDLIPAPILIFGFVDDIILWLFILYYLRDELDRYWVGEKEVPPEKKYRGKKIIDDVKFEVKEQKGDGEKEKNDKTDPL